MASSIKAKPSFTPNGAKDVSIVLTSFLIFKLLLLSVALLVPYQFDTSASHMFTGPPWLLYVLHRLVAWDEIHFIEIALHGMQYEQNWAFSWIWCSVILRSGAKLAQLLGFDPAVGAALIGILSSNIFHLLACINLYHLTKTMFGQQRSIPLISTLLYIVSPAGIFLSVAYTESLFAFLSFLGAYFRAKGYLLIPGVIWGLSCGVRSNGLLWGVPSAIGLDELALWRLGRQIKIVIGGICIAGGFIGPQMTAYNRFCPGRPWCKRPIPLIYGFVQDKYWNVGFLRYWTLAQIPNFLFATPTIILFHMSARYYRGDIALHPYIFVQMMMLISAIFMWHVQIITRVASCLPIAYWYIAEMISHGARNPSIAKGSRYAVYYFILWTLSQAVLFAAFMPPA
ncbi:glycosyltransferase family 76 protein [Tortispora caseinolytica NRRL Y-17796]|uniref:GPI mannosyltransferase 2 n=1 Tax=Tortispora caseinolytica NRRL Y-17796 TaxID=767744 RepID=A0A1E4TH35_9ASCO|nr:glycosyltransferase family 76 protein [Tortispora caseinolytica NRRL Y-17796]